MIGLLMACMSSEVPPVEINKTNELHIEATPTTSVVQVENVNIQEELHVQNDYDFPSDAEIPAGLEGEKISQGKKFIMDTHRLLPENVGNALNCTNCHLNGGTVPNAMTFVGIVNRYPKYRSRTGKEDNLTERINGCFERSMAGVALPVDSEEMVAITAYMTWISSKVENGKDLKEAGLEKLTPVTPNAENGKLLYLSKCASCHQLDGSGLIAPNDQTIYPPLWGENSYNIGAGLARLHKAAAFIKWNMPLGQRGSLTDQESYDIAAYFTVQDRPDFTKKHLDWPKDDKPDDARY
jgi:thiosulfate dehydrogenase